MFCWRVWLCCGEKRNRSAASTDADHCHQPSSIRACGNQRSSIKDHNGIRSCVKDTRKEAAQRASTEFVQNHHVGGQILERLSLQLYLSLCLSLLLRAPLSNDEVRPAGAAAMRAGPPNGARRATGWISVVSRRLARHTGYPRIQSTTASTSRLFSSLDESDSGDLSDQEE